MKNKKTQSNTLWFQKQYDELHDNIFRFCMVKTSNRDTALELTQNSFMKLWEYVSLHSVEDIDNPQAFLYRITRNAVIDYYRKKKDLSVESYDAFVGDDELQDHSHKQLMNAFDANKAVELLQELPSLTRDIVSLRFLESMSIQEIAAIVERDNNTVSVYLHRGLKKLRELLESYEQ